MADFNTHGGYFAPKGYFKVNEGGSHEENPNGGVQIGMDQQGVPNLLEEGEPVYNDYVYSDNIYADGGILEQNNIPVKYAGKLYSDIVDKIFKEMEVEGNELDNISHNGLDVMLTRLANAQEQQKQEEEKKRQEEELANELANLSPEELDQLEAMLAQEEQVPEGQIVPEEQMGPAVPVDGLPMMANGGFLRQYSRGGDLEGRTQRLHNLRLAQEYFATNKEEDARYGDLSRAEVEQLIESTMAEINDLLSGASKSQIKRYIKYLDKSDYPDGFKSSLSAIATSYMNSAKTNNGQNWFTRAMLGSVMADPMTGAVAQSSGWVSNPNGVYQTEEAANSEGAKRLRESLSEISTIPLYELGFGTLGAGLRSLRGVQTATEIIDDAHDAVRSAKHSAKAAQTAGEIKAVKEAAKAERAAQKVAVEIAENSAKANREAIKQAAMQEFSATSKKAAKRAAKAVNEAVNKLVRDEVALSEARGASRKAMWDQVGAAVKSGASATWNAITAPHPWMKYPIGSIGSFGAGLGIHGAFGYGSNDEDYVPYVYKPEEYPTSITSVPGVSVDDYSYDSPINNDEYDGHNVDVEPDGTIASDSTAVVPVATKPRQSVSFGIDAVAIPEGYNENSFPFKFGGRLNIGFLDRANTMALGGNINRVNRYDGTGDSFLRFIDRVSNYKPSMAPGGIAGTYAVDNAFDFGKYKSIEDLEQSEAYDAFTKYVMRNSNDPNVRAYLQALDKGTNQDNGVPLLFDANGNLVENWKDLYYQRRYDKTPGIYHLNPEQIYMMGPDEPFQHWGPGDGAKAPYHGANVNDWYAARAWNTMGLVNPSAAMAARTLAQNSRGQLAGYPSPDGTIIAEPGGGDSGEQGPGADQGANPEGAESSPRLLPTWPRYAGAIGSGLLGLYNAFQSPDRYKAPRINPQLPEGRINLQNQVYNPIDQNMVANSIIAQGNAMNRAIQNSGLGPSSAKALLANDNNVTGNIGTGFIQTWDANNQRKNAVIAANNQAEAQRANFDYTIDAARKQILNEAAVRNAQNDFLAKRLNYQAEGDKYTAISNQISNGLQALSGIGKENFAMNQINTNPANLGYRIGPNGEIYYFNPVTRKWEENKTNTPSTSTSVKTNPQFTMNLGSPYNNFSNNPLSRYPIDPFMGYRNYNLDKDKKKTR